MYQVNNPAMNDYISPYKFTQQSNFFLCKKSLKQKNLDVEEEDGYIRMCDCDANVREREPVPALTIHLYCIEYDTMSYQYITISYQSKTISYQYNTKS